MEIRCDKCDTLYELDDARVTELGVNVKCAGCGHLFLVRRRPPFVTKEMPGLRAHSGSQPQVSGAHEATSRDSMRRDRGWILRLRRTKEELRFHDLTVLRQWVQERRVSRDDDISRGGATWRRLGTIVELESFFYSGEEAEIARMRTGRTGQISAVSPSPGVPLLHDPPRLRTGTPGLGVGPPLPQQEPEGARRFHVTALGAGRAAPLRLEDGAPQAPMRAAATGRTVRPPLSSDSARTSSTPRGARPMPSAIQVAHAEASAAEESSRSPPSAAGRVGSRPLGGGSRPSLMSSSLSPVVTRHLSGMAQANSAKNSPQAERVAADRGGSQLSAAGAELPQRAPSPSMISAEAAHWLEAAGMLDLSADRSVEDGTGASEGSAPVPISVEERPSGAIPRHIIASVAGTSPYRAASISSEQPAHATASPGGSAPPVQAAARKSAGASAANRLPAEASAAPSEPMSFGLKTTTWFSAEASAVRRCHG